MKEKVLDQLKTQFRPEFLNRVDSFVVFRSLSVEEIREIVELMLARVREQLKGQQIQLEVTQDAKDHIIKLGYDADYGARPLRRVIQNMIEDPLAEALLVGQFKAGETVTVDRDQEAGLSIQTQAAEKTPVGAS
jgi:ATP-dependent Clp protease ATP-binding subunit ClpC